MRRPLRSFFEGPASVRNAIRAIVAVTIGTTFLGGVLVWTFDRHDFANLGEAMWWSLQTVTTVGYGDVTPKNIIGRLIGGVILLYSVAFLSILTAAITTTFVGQASRQRRGTDEPYHEQADLGAVLDRLDTIASRLDRLEQGLEARDGAERPALGSAPGAPTPDA